jgi:hypothetical protein
VAHQGPYAYHLRVDILLRQRNSPFFHSDSVSPISRLYPGIKRCTEGRSFPGGGVQKIAGTKLVSKRCNAPLTFGKLLVIALPNSLPTGLDNTRIKLNLLSFLDRRIPKLAVKTDSSSFAVLDHEIAINASSKVPIFPLETVF